MTVPVDVGNSTSPVENVTNGTVPVENVTNVTVPVENVTNVTVPIEEVTNSSEIVENVTELTNQSSNSYNHTEDVIRDVGTSSDSPASSDSNPSDQGSISSSELVESNPSDSYNENSQDTNLESPSDSSTSNVGVSNEAKANAYEVEKQVNQAVTVKSMDHWTLFLLILVFIVLLVYGYKRNDDEI